MSNPKIILIRAYIGNKNGLQKPWFDQALGDVYKLIQEKKIPKCEIICEYENIDNLRKARVPVEYLTDWLLASDIHYIFTHPHQGIILIMISFIFIF